MVWFLLVLACIILWGVTDILLKASMDRSDPLSHYKSFIWIGIVMALAGGITSTWTTTLPETINMVKGDVLYLVPLCVVNAVALLFGLLGMKYLDVSVICVLENVDGAMAALIVYFYYLYTGYIHPEFQFTAIDLIASAAVIIAVILIGSEEQALFLKEAHLQADKRKHRFGALALCFPLVYNLADVFSMAEISGIVSEEAEVAIPALDFFVLECVGFAAVAFCMWLYLLIVKKYTYNPFDESEIIRCGAATGETFGTMTFLLASEINPIHTGPVSASYCIVTIILARIFLKERLTKKQYVSLAILLAGAALLGISEISKLAG